jgi:hypothetical protein
MGCVAAAVATAMMPLAAGAQSTVHAGVLQCRGIGSTTLVVTSVHEFECMYRADNGHAYPYQGYMKRVGLDIGVTTSAGLAWAVFAPTRQISPGDLSGKYGGVAASAAVGVGVGANALIGGSNNTIALQPVSIEGETGVNLALGIAEFELRYAQ